MLRYVVSAAGLAIIVAMYAAMPTLAQSDISASGTGFYVNGGGWLVTNAHVLDGCASVSVNGRGIATDIKLDVQNDLAALRVGSTAPTPPIALRGKPARLGEDIVAFGYPLASILSSSAKVTTGNVNSLLGMNDDTRYLQISSPIQPGSSGGPVVDRQGLLLGVTTATLKSGATGEGPRLHLKTSISQFARALCRASLRAAASYSPVAADGERPPPSTADLSETVVPSVVQLLCHGKQAETDPGPAETTTAPVPKPYTSKRGFETADNMDVVGFDYATLRNVSMGQCQAACEADRSCQALTYNKRQRFCFLKTDAKIAVQNRDATASVVGWLSSTVKVSTFVVASGRDMPGGDYRHIKASFIECYLACEIDGRCRAFAFIREKRSCWMKGIVGTVYRKAGVDLGIK